MYRFSGLLSFVLLVALIAMSGCFGGSGTTGNNDGGGGGGETVVTETVINFGAIIDGSFVSGRLHVHMGDQTSLASGSSVAVTADILDKDFNYYTEEVMVFFTSSLSDSGQATFTNAAITTTSGTVTTYYTVLDATGTDTLTASISIDGKVYEAVATVSIIYSGDVHLQFVSATPQTIALKNTGGPSRSETSVLVFKVTDVEGEPVQGQRISFKLSTEVGGLYLSSEVETSDEEGNVRTTVNAGTVPTHIRVRALVENSNPQVSIVSDALLVSTGLPDQNSISIVASEWNAEAWDWVNNTIDITFLAADHFNNPVPDGTVVYFTSEGGFIDDSCELTNGGCTVEWHSGNPRPDDARMTFLAFCLGEESFIDNNGNGYFDADDLFDVTSDLAEPFRDDDESGSWNVGEPYWDLNYDGEWTPANGIYNGSLCSSEAEALGLCSKDLIYNQASNVLLLSGSYAKILIDPSPIDLREMLSAVSVEITVSDYNNNPMPQGTTIEIATTNGTLVGPASFTVGSTTQSGPRKYSTAIQTDQDANNVGFMTVTVKTPKEVTTIAFAYVYDTAVVDSEEDPE